jgi:hypothetical protein
MEDREGLQVCHALLQNAPPSSSFGSPARTAGVEGGMSRGRSYLTNRFCLCKREVRQDKRAYSRGCLAEIAIVAGDPVLAWRGEDVEVDGVFEGLGGVGKVGGDDEDFAGADDLVDGRAFFSEGEAESALGDVGNLLVGVVVAGDDAAFFEFEASEHGLGAGNKLAGEQRVELLDGKIRPRGVEGFRGHSRRVSRVREKGTYCLHKSCLHGAGVI